MESDKHYFVEGLFIIFFTIAAAVFAVWIGSPGHRDDVLYRIHFADSVSGLALGDPVKFRGVDVGTVKTMALDRENPRLVQVEVRLRRDTPVMTDTKASLQMKGITGVVFIELNGGDPAKQTLVAATPQGQIPEIPSESTGLKAMLEELPKMVQKFEATADKIGVMAGKISGTAEKFSAVGEQTKKVVKGVEELTEKVKENPSLLLRRPRKEDKDETKVARDSRERAEAMRK
jgi:phospholipid/cholesterol/gamma-HCH transport system substrate-binding protein